MVFREVGRMIPISGAIGLVSAIGIARLAQSMLYQLKGYDPLVLIGLTLMSNSDLIADLVGLQ